MPPQPVHLHVGTGNQFGGVEVFLRTLASHPDPDGLCVERFALAWDGQLADALRASGAEPVLLPSARILRPLSVLNSRRSFRRHLEALRPHLAVLHSAWTHAVYGPVLRRARVPLAMMVHTCIPQRSSLERWARRTPLDGVAANSLFTADSARGWYPGHPDPLVLGLPVVAPTVRAGARQHIRSDLGVPEDRAVILQASRLAPGKGLETLIHSLSRLDPLGDWECWLAGKATTPIEIRLETRLRETVVAIGLSGRVRFLGHRSDIGNLMAAADIYCQLNETPEAFGMSFVEAMISGLPVVGPKIGGIREILDDECGAVLQPGDVAALHGVLTDWLRNPDLRRRKGAAARVRAHERVEPGSRLAAFRSWAGKVSTVGEARGGTGH